MTDHVDEILEIIDGGLQRSPEPSYGPIDRARCWRCTYHEPEADSSSGLCPGCRAFLLDEGPDPRLALPVGAFFTDAEVEAIVADVLDARRATPPGPRADRRSPERRDRRARPHLRRALEALRPADPSP